MSVVIFGKRLVCSGLFNPLIRRSACQTKSKHRSKLAALISQSSPFSMDAATENKENEILSTENKLKLITKNLQASWLLDRYYLI